MAKILFTKDSFIDDICLRKLLSIIDKNAFDLISDFSMTAYGLIFLTNEIILNSRRNILEFGSGLSTIVMASFIKKYKIPAKITSVEHDDEWFCRIDAKIKILGLEDFVTVIHAPLVPDHSIGNHNKWYDVSKLVCLTKELRHFEMVLVDGPPAHSASIELSRYGALPFVGPYLADNHCIFLDDANRTGEKKVVELWEEGKMAYFKQHRNRIAVSRMGLQMSSHPNLVQTNFW